jgi:hypothetical protein
MVGKLLTKEIHNSTRIFEKLKKGTIHIVHFIKIPVHKFVKKYKKLGV